MPPPVSAQRAFALKKKNVMRALEVFGFKNYLTGPSDHPVDAPDGTSELMLSSGISHNIFIWVIIMVVLGLDYFQLAPYRVSGARAGRAARAARQTDNFPNEVTRWCASGGEGSMLGAQSRCSFPSLFSW